MNDLIFKWIDTGNFLGTQIARVRYDALRRSGKLFYTENTPLESMAGHPEGCEILIRLSWMRKKDEGSFLGTLVEHSLK